MSQPRSSDHLIDFRNHKDGHYPPQPAQDQTSQRLSHSSDTSIPLFALYLRIAEEHDERRREHLTGDTDQILVFCGLFSTTVAALFLPWISALPDFTSSTSSADSDVSDFNYFNANYYWFCSLVISISCALTALSLRVWVRPRVTLLSYSLPEQARLREIFAARIERSNSIVKQLHCHILVSLIMFFIGLITYLWAASIVFFYLTLPYMLIVVGCHAYGNYYAVFSQPNSPFTRANAEEQTPHTIGYKLQQIKHILGPPFIQIMMANEQAPHTGGDILKRTLDMLRSDDDLERFFEAIPGFRASKIVDDSRRSLDILGRQRLAEALVAFWNRTLSSKRVSKSVKVRRLVVCMRVIEAADLSIAIPQFLHLFSRYLSEIPRSIEIGHSIRPLRNGNVAPLARGIITGILSSAERNGRWFTLATDELGISRDVLRDYLARGDSVLLANLIHITRHFFHGLLQPHPDLTREALSILPSVSKFDILNTVPEVQHDFCDLWNEVVQQARSSVADDNPFVDILVEIRRLYVDLHGTDIALGYFFTSTTGHDDLFRQPSSYPFCMMPDHHPKSNTQLQEASGTPTGVASQT